MTTDFAFLQRRRRLNDAAPAPTTARARIALFEDSIPPTTIAPVGTAAGNVTLSRAEPAIRLSRIASGIGALLIAGASDAYIELTSRAGYRVGADDVPTFGNRPLAQPDESGIVLGLRHIRRMRRLVATGTDMTITTHAGLVIRVPGSADLGMHVVAGQLEIRRDIASSSLAQTYSIGDAE